MKRSISKYIEKNWQDLREKMQAQWEAISDTDLDDIAKAPEQLIEKLQAAYGWSADKIDEEISQFLSKDPSGDYSKIDIERKLAAIQRQLSNYGDKIYEYLKSKSNVIEKSAEKHVKENPKRSIGLALVAGLVLSKIIF